MKIAVTGHRPEDIHHSTTELYWRMRDIFESAEIELVIVGMAAGIDLLAGIAALDSGVPVVAAVPWRGHGPRVADKDDYERIMSQAKKVVYVDNSENYPGPWVYQKRNEYMVDNATNVLSYYNGCGKGGTFNCVQYAKKVGKPIRNLYEASLL